MSERPASGAARPAAQQQEGTTTSERPASGAIAQAPSGLARRPDRSPHIAGRESERRESRGFGLLWLAQSISETGTQIGLLALSLLAIGTLGASSRDLGVLNAARTAPFLLLALPAGALLDRVRRRPILVVADAGRALLLLSIPLANAAGVLTLAQLYGVSALVGVLTVFFDVGYQSYVPVIVPRAELTSANAKLSASRSVAEVAGPGLAGLAVGAVGAAATVGIDAASFAVSGLLCGAIRRSEPVPEPADGGPPRSLRREVAEGLGFVLRHPLLGRIATSAALTNLAWSIATVVLTLYMVHTLRYPPELIGLVLSCAGVGLAASALGAAPAVRRFGTGRVIVGSAVLSGLGVALFPLASPALSVPFVAAGELLYGLAVPLFNITQVSLRQAVTPRRLQGRMHASMRFLVWSTIAVGSLLGGVLGEAVGLRHTLAVAAGLGVLPTLSLVGSSVARLREAPEPPAKAR
jgi:MFS family permease